MDELSEKLPEHVRDTVRSSAELHDRHNQKKSPSQNIVDGWTDLLGEPIAIGVILACIVAWMLLSGVLHLFRFDPPPYPYLELLVSVCALCFSVLILSTQRHENQLAEQRARLTLEFAMVTDKKVAKLIEMLDRQRQDNPLLHNAFDDEATDMAKPAEPKDVFNAIEETHK